MAPRFPFSLDVNFEELTLGTLRAPHNRRWQQSGNSGLHSQKLYLPAPTTWRQDEDERWGHQAVPG